MYSLKIILSLILMLIFSNFSVVKAKDNKDKYYNNLTKDWRIIFPDGNRNAAGPKFFKYISDKYTNFEEFQEYNKLYCAVSGSLIDPNSEPDFIFVNERETKKKICGSYYKCCIPLSLIHI